MSTPARFTAGTRPGSLTDETGLFLEDFSVKPTRQKNEVEGVPAGGTAPQVLFIEAYKNTTAVSLSGTPIPDAGGLMQGLSAKNDADTVTSLANFTASEFFGIDFSSGTLVLMDPELAKARSGTGRKLTLSITHYPFAA